MLRLDNHLSSEGVKRPFVYIMASRRNGTLYVGVTSDLARRTAEHREGAIAGFTKRYGCKLLVWMEPHDRIDEAIAREKQIKAGSRKDKLALIERDNPLWNDLYETLNARAFSTNPDNYAAPRSLDRRVAALLEMTAAIAVKE